jgi:hypothetical protein
MSGRFQFSLRSLLIATAGFAVVAAILAPILRSPSHGTLLLATVCAAGAMLGAAWYYFSYSQLTQYRWGLLSTLEFVLYIGGVLAGGCVAIALLFASVLALAHAI